MKIEKLPKKLSAEPLIDAVCEVRFISSPPASDILTGLLFKELGGGASVQLQRLPASQIPPEIRNSDPNLKSTPLTRLIWGNIALGISDSSLAVSVIGKYPGWEQFKPKIIQIITTAIQSGILSSIERYSIKYVDIIPNPSNSTTGGLDIEIKVGNYNIDKEVAQIRIEIPDTPFLHIIQTITKAEATLASGEKKSGSLVDVDTISIDTHSDPAIFMTSLPDNLQDAHMRNKRIFFECLTPETLESLGPQYD